MKGRTQQPLYTAIILTIIVVLLGGCGLFGGAQRERTNDNAAVIGDVDFGQIVTAEGIGANNTPVGETDTFNDTQDYIYVVAQANHIPAGTTLFARWYRDGDPIEDSSELTANQDYEDTYVEFHLENLQDRMETGDYSVQLFANGNPVDEVNFTVE